MKVPTNVCQRPTTENGNTAVYTGNTYISWNMIDSVEIPTATIDMVVNTRIAFGISIYHSSRDISIFDLGSHIAIFGCRSLSHAIIWEHFLWTPHGRKPQNCRWNFDAMCHSSRDLSISCLGGHIAISGCRSLLLSFEDTFFDVAVLGKLDFVTWITAILILDLFCHISQHDHKISPVSKKIHTCSTTAKQLLVHRLATWLLHFVTTSYSGKVTKVQRRKLNTINFYWFKNWAEGFLCPEAQYED